MSRVAQALEKTLATDLDACQSSALWHHDQSMVTSKDILRIAIEANLHQDTVIRVVRGSDRNLRTNTIEAVRAAAARLGIGLPDEIGKVRAT